MDDDSSYHALILRFYRDLDIDKSNSFHRKFAASRGVSRGHTPPRQGRRARATSAARDRASGAPRRPQILTRPSARSCPSTSIHSKRRRRRRRASAAATAPGPSGTAARPSSGRPAGATRMWAGTSALLCACKFCCAFLDFLRRPRVMGVC